jgi:hypothetical protein
MSKRVILGFGEFASREDAQAAGRMAFLNTAARLYSQILTDLQAAGEAGIDSWAREWNIDAPWVLYVASCTLLVWDGISPADPSRSYFIDPFGPEPIDSEPYAAANWEPWDEKSLTLEWRPWEQPETDFDRHAASALAQYKARVKLMAASVLPQASRITHEHFEWLVTHHFDELGWAEHARLLIQPPEQVRARDRVSVQRAINAKANHLQRTVKKLYDLIDLKPIQLRRGRRGAARSQQS